ncbi:hypothetical protein WKH56_08940 [Priestia sp. SB1]|uniref:hypothetical protein n=1 Tax=Priestia sp. SB1 TaxID=3132359 RepID=UPI00317904B2
MRGYRYYGKSSFGCVGMLFFIFGLPILIVTSYIWLPILRFFWDIFLFFADIGEMIFGEGNAAPFFLILGIIFMILLVAVNRFLQIQPTDVKGTDKIIMTRTQYRLRQEGWLHKVRKFYNAPTTQERIHLEKIDLLKAQIDIADEFLRNKVNIIKRFENRKDAIEKWFHQYFYLKEEPKYFTQSSVVNNSISLTIAETVSLEELLNLRSEHYIPHRSKDPSKEATMLFIIENCPVIKELTAIQKSRGYRLSIDFHLVNQQKKSVVVCFGLANIVKPVPFYKR